MTIYKNWNSDKNTDTNEKCRETYRGKEVTFTESLQEQDTEDNIWKNPNFLLCLICVAVTLVQK